MEEKFKRCVKESLMDYTVEKTAGIISRCNNPDLAPLGFVNCITLVKNDVITGIDGHTGKKIQQAPISIFPYEVERLARCYRGDQFADEVGSIYKSLNQRTANTGVKAENPPSSALSLCKK